MTTLTQHLIGNASAELRRATEHPFLIQAATNALDPVALKTWLGQDRLYAYSYIHFISNLISRIPLQTKHTLGTSLEGQWIETLIDCLVNIRREIHLFEDVAMQERWLDEICDAEPDKATKAYQNLFAEATAAPRPLLIAMTTLWATEHCYYTAWSYAAAHLPQGKDEGELDVMQRTLIPNWSSAEFKDFVDVLAGLVDDYAATVLGDGPDWLDAERAFKAVLQAERDFWPNVSR